jgi:hypothetical protein
MRRSTLLAGALLIPALPIVAASPASAADNVICVPANVAGCNQFAATIQAAITMAGANAVDDTIRIAAGTYTETPWQIDGSAHAITLQGAGQGQTKLTIPSSASTQTYLGATQATVKDLTIQMVGGANSANDVGLNLAHSTADHVTVDGPAIQGAIGIQGGSSTVSHSTVSTPPAAAGGTRAFYSSGGNTVTDTTLTGSQGFDLSDPGTIDTLSRTSIRADSAGVLTDGGRVDIDDSVIDLGLSAGTGLAPVNFNNSVSPVVVDADHVTIVGGGPGSKGAWAFAGASGAKQTSTVTLTNSILDGPATSLVADASNDGAQGGNSTAIVSVSYTDYETTGGTIGAHGAGGVTLGAGNLVGADPLYVDAAGGDFHLTTSSPVVDKGNPAAGGPSTDRDGLPRVVDGDAVVGAVRDMGAYELSDTIRPETSITGPSGLTNDSTPTFGLVSEAGATFQCKVDAAAYSPCTSPFTTGVLGEGPHSLSVTSKDPAGNIDLSPATRSFTVDTTAPDTTVTKPAKRTTKSKVKIVFSSEAGASFECQVDGKAFKPCTSPLKLKVKQGKHTVLVRAVDVAGNVDASPAKVKFKRVPKHH